MKKKEVYQPVPESLNLYDKFLAEASIDRLQKILARFELLKMALNVPGDIVECGVFKGSGIYTLAKLQKIIMPNNQRKIVGFDFFETERSSDSWNIAIASPSEASAATEIMRKAAGRLRLGLR